MLYSNYISFVLHLIYSAAHAVFYFKAVKTNLEACRNSMTILRPDEPDIGARIFIFVSHAIQIGQIGLSYPVDFNRLHLPNTMLVAAQ